MAYGTTGYRAKANYYSNPDVIFPGTGTPTGVAGVSNNAKVLNEMIGQMAALGDESGTCGYVPPSTTTTTTAPTTTTAASCVINESSYICAGNNALDSKKVADWQECANHCASIASCEVGFHNITLVHFPSRKLYLLYCLGLDHQQVEPVLDQDERLLLREPQELDLGHQAVRQC